MDWKQNNCQYCHLTLITLNMESESALFTSGLTPVFKRLSTLHTVENEEFTWREAYILLKTHFFLGICGTCQPTNCETGSYPVFCIVRNTTRDIFKRFCLFFSQNFEFSIIFLRLKKGQNSTKSEFKFNLCKQKKKKTGYIQHEENLYWAKS